MNTISGKGSLILWKNNVNKSGIATSTCQQDIKQNYIDFFTACSNTEFKGKFCDTWQTIINGFEKQFKDFWSEKTSNSDSANLLFHKFRGNVAEILVEAFVQKGVFSYWDKNTYSVPDDRYDEDYTDARALSSMDNIIEGIQIKNWKGSVDLHVFQKACAQSALDFMDKTLHPDAELYRNKPRQYIISFSDGKTILSMHKEFEPIVKFIGPNEINKAVKPFQENSCYGLKNIFKNIVDEVKNV